MIVCITEKPSVGADIARLLGANTRRDGYFEGNGYQVTWTFGHLCCLKEPEDYSESWKRWSLGALPMLPPRFGIKLLNQESIKRQFNVIKTLAASATEIINCGDAGQEGELIQRWVMQKANVKCPVKRLWTSSLTDQALRAGFQDLLPQQNYDNLYFAGLSRAIGDWILGINATRLYSLKYSSPGNVLSVGRVQTPTLAMIVKRHLEITEFKPKDFFEIHTVYRDTDFMASGKYDTEEKAKSIISTIASEPFTITDVQQKKGRESAPRLFDLTSLQVECNKRWGWSAEQTLRIIQSLYEKKVTTYPRVDNTYLPEDMHPKVPDILRRMTPYAPQTAPVLADRITKSKKVFDNSKVTDHHAIIPTGESPSVLIGDERKMYHLIALRFIGVFYPDCIFQQTIVQGIAGKIEFKTTGKVITDPGWRVLEAKNAQNEENTTQDDENRLLPDFVKGESGPHSPKLVKKTTQPPKPYTQGTLLRAMESAGRQVDDETLREALKENGIGRPSTRGAIIETLFKRKYIEQRRKSIFPTQAGIDLINVIKEDLLKSASLTGIWENKLRKISRGDYSAAEFINELKILISTIVHDVMVDNSQRRIQVDNAPQKAPAEPEKPKTTRKPRQKKEITALDQIKCPVCKKGHILKGRTSFGCSQYASGCTFLLPFTQLSAETTAADVAKAIAKLSRK